MYFLENMQTSYCCTAFKQEMHEVFCSTFIQLLVEYRRLRYHCTKMKFSVKDFFGKYEQICWKLRICSHLLKKYLIENFIFYVV